MTTLIKLLTASIVSASLLTACAAPIQEPSQLRSSHC